uniref:Uncharacterized protein n=1 Tax=Salix viminalis TaxID=40686 RepID=A0A6N2LIG8_SALVM
MLSWIRVASQGPDLWVLTESILELISPRFRCLEQANKSTQGCSCAMDWIHMLYTPNFNPRPRSN